MIIVLKPHSTDKEIDHILERIQERLKFEARIEAARRGLSEELVPSLVGQTSWPNVDYAQRQRRLLAYPKAFPVIRSRIH